MTIQLATVRHGTSKKALEAAMTAMPERVRFADPSIFAPREFAASEMRLGEKFACVMDPETRRRFALIKRRLDGTFRVG